MDMFNYCFLVLSLIISIKTISGADDDYNVLHTDGSFEFGYNNPDSYHYADGNRNNVVRGEFGGRNPGTGAIDSTVYTAGPRGFRPRGKNIARKYDLNQNGPRSLGSRDDPYYDPYEDPSYSFSFRTRQYNRDENDNRVGDVTGRYSYLDDVGERHNVEYIAGKNTGFHVKTPFPDSNPRAYGPLYFNGKGKPIPRGRTSIQRGLDGSYKFVSAGPDQRRTETSDSTGHVRGSYTYLDDKGVQHSVHYIAGPETGYRVLKNVKGPHLPTVFPFGRPGIIPPDFYDYEGKDSDVFDTAASGHISPVNNDVDNSPKPEKNYVPELDSGIDVNKDDFNKFNTDLSSTTSFPPSRPTKPFGHPSRPFGPPSRPFGGGANRPSYDNEDDLDFDLFGDGGSSTSKPSFHGETSKTTSSRPTTKPNGSGTSRPFGSDLTRFGDSSEENINRPRPGSSTTLRPTTGGSFSGIGNGGRPGNSRPSIKPGGGKPGGNRPGGRPSNKPNYDKFGDDSEPDDDFGLFGSESNSRPPYGNKPVHFGISQDNGSQANCPKCVGTIVTNVGYNTFSLPPGVSVRAHVQSIDLFPLSDIVPSPSEQFKADTNINTEQLNEVPSNMVVTTVASTTSTNSSTIPSTTNSTGT